MSEHVWAQDSIAAYLAGGLDAAEDERLERHVADCPACERFLGEARSLERKLAPLVHAADPGADMEDRIIQALPRAGAMPMLDLRSGKRKALMAIVAVAAAVLLAAVGTAVSALIENNQLGPVRMAQAAGDNRVKANGSLLPALTGGNHLIGLSGGKPGERLHSADDLAKELRDRTLPFSVEQPIGKESEGRRRGAGTAADLAQATSDNYSAVNLPPLFQRTPMPPVSQSGDEKTTNGISTITGLTPAGTLTPNVGDARADKEITAQNEKKAGASASAGGSGPALSYNFTSGGYREFMPGGYPGSASTGTPNPQFGGAQAGKPAAAETKEGPQLVWNYTNNGTLPNLGVNYFKPGDDQARQQADSRGDKDVKQRTKEVAEEMFLKALPPQQTAPAEAGKDPQKGEPAPPPSPRRIIIRTGDLEFEIDSFDASVAVILKLVSAAKGSFVATINSDKLANGKVRGAVVVRVPPELLDNFILDLRKELSKNGELKNQRIGSQDITKQYTDLESRLRAARAMEERLLSIIKDGKGQIKDLLAAEKELGVWRTQIESLEGELRYYSNQAAYSTLTIKLYEKDIHNAASITESERVQAGLEVEDVEKAHQEALKAIMEAKGRVTRSELKQHAAGQFNAIINFEVASEAAGPMRDRLKQLGTMVRLQVDRVQQTEDGGPAPKDGKIERGPTLFFVSIYNLANVAPRETVILRLAAADVPAVFSKLRGAIAIANGHVINAQLDEKDRKNITAQLDFHVSRQTEGDVLAALLGAGETLTRQVSRVPENDNVTDAKVLYRIALVDADSIQPRETVVVRLAAADVPAGYQKLREALARAKARIYTAQLNEQDRRNVTAQLDFALSRGEEAALQAAVAGAGETLSRQATRLPESPNLTDAKILFQVTLLDVDSVQPRETVAVRLAAIDVPTAYDKLRTAVAQAKGRILTAQLNEQDRRNITAQLDVTMNRGDARALEAALAGAGEILSRQVTRAPDTWNVTDAKVHAVIDLMAAAAIAPRETTTLALVVSDVAATLRDFSAQVKEAQGRTVETQVGQERNGQVTARVVFDVPWSAATLLADKFKDAGQVRVHQVTRDPQAPEGKLAIGRLIVTVSTTAHLVPSDESLWSELRGGLAFSLRGLSISAGLLIRGLLFVLPWLLVLYAAFWLVRRLWRVEPVQSGAPAASAGDVPPAGSP